MATVVNSKKEKLPMMKIIMTSIVENAEDPSREGVYEDLLEIPRSMTRQAHEFEQIGNTVFVSKKEERKGKTVVSGLVYNLDTAFNMLNNMKDYANKLNSEGVDYYKTPVLGKTYFPMLKQLIRKLAPKGFKGKAFGSKTKKNKYYWFVMQFPEAT